MFSPPLSMTRLIKHIPLCLATRLQHSGIYLCYFHAWVFNLREPNCGWWPLGHWAAGGVQAAPNQRVPSGICGSNMVNPHPLTSPWPFGRGRTFNFHAASLLLCEMFCCRQSHQPLTPAPGDGVTLHRAKWHQCWHQNHLEHWQSLLALFFIE